MAGEIIKVLLVEDNPGDVFLLQEFLKDVTRVVVELTPVERLSEALIYLGKKSFDVILLDLSLPDSQGWETYVSTHRHAKITPIIVLTGIDDETLAIRAMQEGAQDYLVKGQVTGDLLVRSMRYAIERQRVEEALRQSEERFRVALKNSPIFVYNQDRELRYTWVYNPFSGLTVEQMLGKKDLDLIPLANALHLNSIKHDVLTTGIGVRKEVAITIGKETRYYDLTVEPLRNESQEVVGITCASIDISERLAALYERKLAEEKIREQAALLDITTDAICVRDLENRILFWNKGAENLYGWQAQEAWNQDATELLYDEEPPAEVETALLNVISKGKWQGELTISTKHGKQILVASRWILVCDEQGHPKSILTVDTDITEKKQLEAQLFRTQRLESIGTLASGIAHDLNNILTPILAGAQLLPLKFPDADERTRHLLEILEVNARRGSDLVKQVLSFARGVEGKRITLQLRHLIVEVSKILKETFPKSIDINTDVPQELWTVSADSTQLHQVLMNLCVNARDAMPHGGVLSITGENLLIDENYARMNLEAKTGPYIVITVSDTGVGIPGEILDRIFEPFFTTKEVGQGTGLGLSTILGIIKSHGGFVNVYSEVGKGTRFKVYLPAEGGMETVSPEELTPMRGDGELILVVDDEPAIQDVTKASLETYNYKTLIASDGIEAIALYAKHTKNISVVLMDMMLPALDGLTAIRTLQKINPDVKIIATSGLMSSNKLGGMADTGVSTFLSKPYTVNELLLTLQKIIRAKPE
ncbi:hybrid sensor histidine kinase/response regulator [Cylindrospermum sp. FACHB-282]|uniref:hybrid sensor histidine kinase/response regulator n=1 Tax=Cylindrospermum sp. FACHB-282 TaxID=2692794 RepID=UPI001685801F|nr:response regulator [Cylindrospermum sp. FACHB-282]MBD2385534.1 response regulator [Cylindrospermum sp. FACHB-282]